MFTVRSATEPGGSGLHGGWLLSAAVAWLAVGTTSPALAQPVDKPSDSCVRVQATTPAADSSGDGDTTGFWRRTADGIKKVWSSGRSDLFVPGYIWHAPWQYSGEQRARYNTVAWGIGYGRTMVDAAGRSRTLFGMVSADSYDHLQVHGRVRVACALAARQRPAEARCRLHGTRDRPIRPAELCAVAYGAAPRQHWDQSLRDRQRVRAGVRGGVLLRPGERAPTSHRRVVAMRANPATDRLAGRPGLLQPCRLRGAWSSRSSIRRRANRRERGGVLPDVTSTERAREVLLAVDAVDRVK